MKVPLTIRDHLERAAPGLRRPPRRGRRARPAGQPARGPHLPPAPRAGRGPGRPARRAGRGAGRAGGHRVAQLGAPAGRLLRRQRVGPGLRAHQLPAVGRRDRLHRGPLRRHACCWSTPSSTRRWPTSRSTHRFVLGPRRRPDLPLRRRARALGARRGRHRHHQLHVRHHGAAQGRADDPSQPVGQRRHLRVAHGGERPRRLPAHPADVPLQRLGHALRGDRPWACATSCCARSTAPRSCAGSSARA